MRIVEEFSEGGISAVEVVVEIGLSGGGEDDNDLV